MYDFPRRHYDFITLYTHGQQPILAEDSAKSCFLNALSECKQQFGLVVAAYVLLNDHVHLLLSDPSDSNANAVLSHLRGTYQRLWRETLSPQEEGPFWERKVEQRRLNNSEGIRAHLDYIHYDPVWHGLVQRASEYPWSSLPARISQGHFASNWAEMAAPAAVAKLARRD